MRELIDLLNNILIEADAPPPRVIKLGSKNSPGLEAFMNDFIEYTHEHPLDHTARLVSNASIVVRPFDGAIHVSDIRALAPGKGGGREALVLLCQLADKHNVKLTCTAKNYGGDDRLSTRQLKAWYERYGFAEEDEEFSGDDEDGYDLIRYPQ